MSYSGAWKTGAYRQVSLQGSVPALEHREPVDLVDNANWQNAPENPELAPPEIEHKGQFTVDSAPGGPTWNPPGHEFGPGYGAGLSWAVSMAQNNTYRHTDDGSVRARHTEPVVARDGEYHVDRIQMEYGGNLAPAGTPDLPAAPGMSQGLNTAMYPNRHVGHYIPRWRDRVFERRTWGVEFRPVVVPNAYTAPEQQPYGAGNQYTSPYAAAQSTRVRVVNVSAPQMRRTPTPWDESITQDGTAQNVAAIGDYGFARF